MAPRVNPVDVPLNQSTWICGGTKRGRDDVGIPNDKWTQAEGWVDLWAPPRGYAVYVPQW